MTIKSLEPAGLRSFQSECRCEVFSFLPCNYLQELLRVSSDGLAQIYRPGKTLALILIFFFFNSGSRKYGRKKAASHWQRLCCTGYLCTVALLARNGPFKLARMFCAGQSYSLNVWDTPVNGLFLPPPFPSRDSSRALLRDLDVLGCSSGKWWWYKTPPGCCERETSRF